ncbi:hypothetical protein [Ferviditalea candida]|uniref:Hemerythrin-like domain-containing protein n=1 Tax=Ferviditalea candida TaxID=3108399 RepID=A0ABU5ZNE2_9BACL|nr:hypothetical protein [Paenibacillaceae bacterium T2]
MQINSMTFNESFILPILDNKVSKAVQFSFPEGKVLEKHNNLTETKPETKNSIAPQLQSFIQEHEDLSKVLDETGGDFDTSLYTRADQMIEEELDKHFRYEEEILFPVLGKYIGTGARLFDFSHGKPIGSCHLMSVNRCDSI